MNRKNQVLLFLTLFLLPCVGFSSASLIRLPYLYMSNTILVNYDQLKNIYFFPEHCAEKGCQAFEELKKIRNSVKKLPDFANGVNPGEKVCQLIPQAERIQLISINNDKLIMCKFADESMVSVGALWRCHSNTKENCY
jgi:tRNA(Ile2) C34 agmatinyltransferase TiaS